MGSILNFHCQTCHKGIQFRIGCGMLYPKIYAATVAKAKNGEFGDTLKSFFEIYPDGAIDCSSVVIVCRNCGNLEQALELSMYCPKADIEKDTSSKIWSVAVPCNDIEYVAPAKLRYNYDLYAEYPHKCSKCQGDAYIFRSQEKVPCPVCKNLMKHRVIGSSD